MKLGDIFENFTQHLRSFDTNTTIVKAVLEKLIECHNISQTT